LLLLLIVLASTLLRRPLVASFLPTTGPNLASADFILATISTIVLPVGGLCLFGLFLGQWLGVRVNRSGIGRNLLPLAGFLILFLSIVIGVGDSIKNQLKGFPELTARIQHVVGEGELVVVRSLEDEFFDPVLFYWGKRVKIVPPEPGKIPCSELSSVVENGAPGDEATGERAPTRKIVVLARQEFFDEFLRMMPPDRKLRSLVKLYSKFDRARERDERGIALFSCEVTIGPRSNEDSIRVDQSWEVFGT
jgi:hypothetical protein